MTQNEQNLINKINEQSSIIEWQKLALSEKDKRIEALQEPNMCYGCRHLSVYDRCSYIDCNRQPKLKDNYELKQ